jgi:hypothetical protein
MRATQSVEDGIPTPERGNEVVRLWVRCRSRWSRAVNYQVVRVYHGPQTFGQRQITPDRNGAVARALIHGLVDHERRLIGK